MYFLESEIIGLRELDHEDIDNGYGDWFNDRMVCKYNTHHRFPVCRRELEAYINLLKDDRTRIVLAVVEKKDSKHIGNISLQEIDLLNRQAEIAFVFGEKEYWGRGYATEAARLLIDHGFTELGLNRVYFGTSEENIGMQKIADKLKFQKGGVLRQALFKNGRYMDIYQYDLLKEEWMTDNIIQNKTK